MSSLGELQQRWKTLHQDKLPKLAKARDPAQKHWPVHLDHCFARIVLDNALGIDKPWTEVVKSPAIWNMSASQLGAAVELAEKIATGTVDLVALDERSLLVRGKKGKKRAGDGDEATAPQRKKVARDSIVSAYFKPSSPTVPATKRMINSGKVDPKDAPMRQPDQNPAMSAQLKRIETSSLTPFRKQTLTLLCQIPPGSYSTYGAMSDFISKTSHKTCSRAIGSAMRNNPFAPEVPCHRILAGDGSLGGFGGSWGEDGKHASEKHRLLEAEGVRFDSSGRVRGPVFRDFT